jgi:hypothetical protein
MPTIFDQQSGTMITADWQTKKVILFNQHQNWQIYKDLNQ